MKSMKKISLIALLLVAVGVGLSSCGAAGGAHCQAKKTSNHR
jgi:predicted small secreted protein